MRATREPFAVDHPQRRKCPKTALNIFNNELVKGILKDRNFKVVRSRERGAAEREREDLILYPAAAELSVYVYIYIYCCSRFIMYLRMRNVIVQSEASRRCSSGFL